MVFGVRVKTEDGYFVLDESPDPLLVRETFLKVFVVYIVHCTY